MNLKSVVLAVLSIALSHATRADDTRSLKPAVRQQCLAVLRAGLQGEDFWPAIHAAEALTLAGQTHEVREYLEPKLDTETDDQRRCGLARELARAGDRRRSGVMLEILRKSDTHGHVHAAESLYKVGWVDVDSRDAGSEQASAPLQHALATSNDMRLRLMAAAALAKYGQGSVRADSFALLRQSLRDEKDPAVFRLCAWVLGRIGEHEDCDLIRRRLDDAKNDASVSAFLEHALAALGDPQGRQALLGNLASSDARIRTYAAVFAGESGISQAAPFLIRQLDDDDLDARIRAAQSLLLLAQ